MPETAADTARTDDRELKLAEQAWSLRSVDPDGSIRVAVELCAAPEATPVAVARALAALGYARLRAGTGGAEATLREALRLAADVQDELATARATLALGTLLLGRADYVAASRRFQEAALAFERAEDPTGVAGSLVNLSVVHKNLGDHPRAIELLVQAADRFRQVGDRYGEAVTTSNIVAVYRDLGDFEAALPLAERAHALVQGSGRPAFESHVLAGLGAVLAGTGEVDRGRALLELAAEGALASGVPMAISEALGNLARLEVSGDPDRARELLDRALPAAQASGDAWAVASGLLVLGEAADDPVAARAAFEQAAELAGRHRERGLAEKAHRGAATAAEQAQDLRAALKHWRAAADAAEEERTAQRTHRLALVGISAAVSEARAEAEGYRARIREVSEISRHRADLLGMVAHDLRNPLLAAQLSSDLARMCGVEPAAIEHIDRVDAALKRMNQIIEAVCDDAAAERGALALRSRDEDLLRLTRAIALEHEPAARQKDQHIVVVGSRVTVPVDAGRVFHAVHNLLSNAIKYSPRGADVVVRVVPGEELVRLEFDDEGPGVEPEGAERLFRPFERGAAEPTAGERSTGLGLYIARRMVELHDGRIGVERRPDRPGARFWIELPR